MDAPKIWHIHNYNFYAVPTVYLYLNSWTLELVRKRKEKQRTEDKKILQKSMFFAFTDATK